MSRAYYSAEINTFLYEHPSAIFGILAKNHEFDLEDTQKRAWLSQIKILQDSLSGISGYIYFEFSIPRMGKRVDTIIVSNGIVFVIEFKIGESAYRLAALDQVLDYAVDLKNFHETSHNFPIVPILVSTEAPEVGISIENTGDLVFEPLKVNSSGLRNCIQKVFGAIENKNLDPKDWELGSYKPTPTIIEAAQALYLGHNVEEISRSDAGVKNLTATSNAIDEIIEYAKKNRKKAICFITGVPGAGKTLAGLNIANRRLKIGVDEHAVFLSGNGPLVSVLREALTRNDMQRGESRTTGGRKAKTFIQNIHHFRDDNLENGLPPLERVVIFDEAQRAWTREETARFMKQKKGIFDFAFSEPEFLIGVMDRNEDWAVIICLIGGGQEINHGEAGLTEWFDALRAKFPQWQVYFSDQISDSEFLFGEDDRNLKFSDQVIIDNRLHLATSIRSFRSENVAKLVKAILDCDLSLAMRLFPKVSKTYPIYLTRDLHTAKNWIKAKARGTERYGLLASSGGARLRPEGIFTNAEIEVEQWFLNDKQDVRSSYALEGVATEFDIQGLELDWTLVAWDADLRYTDGIWDYKAFKGTKWQSINDPRRQIYLKNAYRVLLTRARQGMVIFVPKGDESDITRPPEYYNGIYEYLKNIGLKEI